MASDFELGAERIRSGTHAVIDLDAVANNVSVLRSMVAGDVSLMAVVKADGYGHGAVECGRAAVEAGASMLGVARIREAVYLRRNGLDCPIVVIGPPSIAEIELALRHEITLSVGSEEVVHTLLAWSDVSLPVKVHVKVDTGMHRYGFATDVVTDVVRRLVRHDGIDVEGLFTHLTSADERDPTPTDAQIERFRALVDEVTSEGLRPRYIHYANSAAVLTGRVEGTNLIRCGIAIYGLSPSDEVEVDDRFVPALSLRSTVARCGDLDVGDCVSYGRTYTAADREQIAAIPVGYADGLSRGLSNTGWFVINGERAPIRGRVCMDQTVVAVAGGVAEGDEVLIYGNGASGEMTLDDVAQMASTNNYEVATRGMPRVPRLYVRSSRPVALETVLDGERARVDRPS